MKHLEPSKIQITFTLSGYTVTYDGQEVDFTAADEEMIVAMALLDMIQINAFHKALKEAVDHKINSPEAKKQEDAKAMASE